MKRNKLIFYLIGALVVIVIYQIMSSSLSQPGLEQFAGKYEELGFYRNENNTGPVVRVYAIRALDPSHEWMKEFAETQPHTKYGRTIIFFFSSELSEKVNLLPQEPFYPKELQPYLLAKFEKTPMGEVRFSTTKP